MNDDEDRKFFRAAAEAIVATSMNNPIDPTILELLRRIQYASLSKSSPNVPQDNTEFLRQQLMQQQSQPHSQNLGLIDSTKASNFPTFNLNYFGLQGTTEDGAGSTSSTTASTGNNNINSNNNHNDHGNADWIRSHHHPTHSTDSINDLGPKQSPHQSIHAVTPRSNDQHTPSSSTATPYNQDPNSPGDGESKPFICRDCTLSFRRSSDLRRHQRAHLPVLPHVCHRCGKGFARKDALKRHTDTLTCKRNRERLLSTGGDLDGILNRANEIKRRQLGGVDEGDDFDEENEED